MKSCVAPLAIGITLLATPLGAETLSGYAFLTPESREMQNDAFANPGMRAVDKGRVLFYAEGENGKNCVSCHDEEGKNLDIARIATYPRFSAELNRPITLQDQINICWEDRLDNIPYVYDCTELMQLEAFVRNKARGETVRVSTNGPMQPYYEAGRELYYTRFGQVNMACNHCHEQHQGQMLRGQMLTQGQSNGFPEYRLGSGRVTSLQRRFSECFRSFRAEPFEPGSEEYINLEVYVNARGNGLKIETPAVRY